MGGVPRVEEELRQPIASFLAARGLSVRHEVWINGRIADVFAFDEDTTVAVELKLADWREALVQAMAYQLGALYTYVALPFLSVARALDHAHNFRQQGIGLLAIVPPARGTFRPASEPEPDAPIGEPAVRELVAPEPSERYLPFLADKIVRDLKRPKRTWTSLPVDP